MPFKITFPPATTTLQAVGPAHRSRAEKFYTRLYLFVYLDMQAHPLCRTLHANVVGTSGY